jgi:dissimilatory sulfite reductase (desulfoviridin) alpha/beta subunit
MEDLIRAVQFAGRQHGYAIAVHGSLTRDIDFVAIPWVEWAKPPEQLAKAIEAVTGGLILPPDHTKEPIAKPHGRLAWSIHGVMGTYIDLSVMPPVVRSET